MIKAIDRVPLSRLELLQSHPSYSSPSKKIKIQNNKFPVNFFLGKNTDKKMIASTPIVRKQSRTHQELRNKNQNRVGLSIPRRQMSTALQNKDNDDELIMGVISTAREMRQMIRKHSLQAKRDKKSRN